MKYFQNQYNLICKTINEIIMLYENHIIITIQIIFFLSLMYPFVEIFSN